MPAIPIVPPTSEPLSLPEAKLQCHYTADDQDRLISSYITTAREYCEKFTRRCIPIQTFKLVLDEFPDDIINIDNPPLISITSIKYYDSHGNQQTIDSSLYRVDAVSQPGRVAPVTAWPSTQSRINAVEIVFQAGYAVVPQTIKQAMRLLVTDYWENRGATVEKDGIPNPVVENLLWAEKGRVLS